MISQRILKLMVVALLVTFGLFTNQKVYAHCDKLDGPVAMDAREALDTGNFAEIQIWVAEGQEAELRQTFQQARKVRKLNPDAQELSDRYFIETAVRLHREAEGMPYTGVKPAGTQNPPDILAGDRALETGQVEDITRVLQNELNQNVQKWYEQAMQAKQNKEKSVEAGREWVDAYVQYIVYVHSLYQKIQSPPAHGVGE